MSLNVIPIRYHWCFDFYRNPSNSSSVYNSTKQYSTALSTRRVTASLSSRLTDLLRNLNLNHRSCFENTDKTNVLNVDDYVEVVRCQRPAGRVGRTGQTQIGHCCKYLSIFPFRTPVPKTKQKLSVLKYNIDFPGCSVAPLFCTVILFLFNHNPCFWK